MLRILMVMNVVHAVHTETIPTMKMIKERGMLKNRSRKNCLKAAGKEDACWVWESSAAERRRKIEATMESEVGTIIEMEHPRAV